MYRRQFARSTEKPLHLKPKLFSDELFGPWENDEKTHSTKFVQNQLEPILPRAMSDIEFSLKPLVSTRKELRVSQRILHRRNVSVEQTVEAQEIRKHANQVQGRIVHRPLRSRNIVLPTISLPLRSYRYVDDEVIHIQNC